MKKISYDPLQVLAALFALLWIGTSAYALELPIFGKNGQKKIPVPRLKLGLDVGGSYSDNVNTTPGRNSKGVRMYVTPQVQIEMPDLLGAFSHNARVNRLYVDGGYRYGYLGVNGTKVDFHKNAHTANAGLRYSISPKASLGSQYVFQRDQYPFSGAGDTYTVNDVNTGLKVQLTNRLTLAPYHKFQAFNDTGLDGDVLQSTFQDYSDNRVGWDSCYTLSPKVAVIGNSEFQNRAFHENNTKDFYSYGGKGGLEIKVTPKITASGQGGYAKRYFDVNKDGDSILWDAKIQYTPSRRIVTNLYYTQDMQDTLVTGFLAEKASASLVDIIPRNYRLVRTQRFGTNIGLTLTDKDRIDTGFSYQIARAGSGDDVTPATVGVAKKLEERDYELSVNYSHAFTKWLGLQLGYAHIGRNTNIADNFRANVLTFGMHLGW